MKRSILILLFSILCLMISENGYAMGIGKPTVSLPYGKAQLEMGYDFSIREMDFDEIPSEDILVQRFFIKPSFTIDKNLELFFSIGAARAESDNSILGSDFNGDVGLGIGGGAAVNLLEIEGKPFWGIKAELFYFESEDEDFIGSLSGKIKQLNWEISTGVQFHQVGRTSPITPYMGIALSGVEGTLKIEGLPDRDYRQDELIKVFGGVEYRISPFASLLAEIDVGAETSFMASVIWKF